MSCWRVLFGDLWCQRGSATHGKGTIHFPSQVSGAAAAAAPAGGAVDDSPPPPDGNGGIPGVIGACNFIAVGWRWRSWVGCDVWVWDASLLPQR